MDFITNEYFLTILAGILFVIYQIIENKLNNREVKPSLLVKPFIIGSVITYIVLYIKDNSGITKTPSITPVLTGTPKF